MKNAKVAKIRHGSALVSQLGRSKNSRSHLKLILCFSLSDVIPHIKFHLNWMENTEVPILEILDPQNFFERSAIAKLSKLEPFAWSHWIWNISLIRFTKWQNFPKLPQAKIGNLFSPA